MPYLNPNENKTTKIIQTHKNSTRDTQLLEMYKVEEEEYNMTTKREFYA